MLKVTLINPSQFTKYPQPPIGLALIAAVLERAGYQVTILEANLLKLQSEDVVTLVTDADVIGDLEREGELAGAFVEVCVVCRRRSPPRSPGRAVSKIPAVLKRAAVALGASAAVEVEQVAFSTGVWTSRVCCGWLIADVYPEVSGV